jgi:hypothetical protein
MNRRQFFAAVAALMMGARPRRPLKHVGAFIRARGETDAEMRGRIRQTVAQWTAEAGELQRLNTALPTFEGMRRFSIDDLEQPC